MLLLLCEVRKLQKCGDILSSQRSRQCQVIIYIVRQLQTHPSRLYLVMPRLNWANYIFLLVSTHHMRHWRETGRPEEGQVPCSFLFASGSCWQPETLVVAVNSILHNVLTLPEPTSMQTLRGTSTSNGVPPQRPEAQLPGALLPLSF